MKTRLYRILSNHPVCKEHFQILPAMIKPSPEPIDNKGGTIMYYSSGNYEAFARPEKPEGVEHKSAYIIGTGLAALTAACYLVRDAQMPGKRIHIFEKDPIPGGACDGYEYPGVGYVMRGGREMDNHFEVMWDLFRSIPSIETEGVSVLDEYYWLNKKDPNFSLCRATENRARTPTPTANSP